MLVDTESGRFDWINPLCMAVLGVIGLFFIYSAQLYTGGNLWLKQIFWFGIGAAGYLVISHLDYKILLENATWIFLAGIVLLVLLWTPIGVVREGARRWLNLIVLNYQPSEAAKISTLIMVASILAGSELGSIRESLYVLLKVFIVTAIPMGLIFAQPDLGSCLILPPMVLSLLYVSRLSERFFVLVFGVFLVAISLLSVDLVRYTRFLDENGMTALEARGQYEKTSVLLRDYQRERILSFLAPDVVDPSGTGSAWNSNQARQAVGTGGLAGKGWKNGLQARLGYLPRTVAHNDFIFAVLAEETGFVGGILVIGVFGLLIINTIRIAGRARDRFGMLLSLGIAVIFLIHVFINIGMTVGITPITGLPLPFLSYGGSFVLSCCLLQGIVQSVNRYRRHFT